MIIRRMTMPDAEKYRVMETGLEHDYVKDIIEIFIKNDNMYMAEDDDGTLLAVCRLQKMMEGYGFLGSARTNIHHRGRGIHTELTSYAIDEAKRENLRWIGLTTDETNTAVHRMMDKLNFTLVGKSVACTVKNDFKICKPPAVDREVIDNLDDKRKALKHNLDKYNRKFFYFTPYYALPYRDDAITDQYIKDLKAVRVGTSYYFVMDIDWGDGFKTRQMHYYGGNVLKSRELLNDFLYYYSINNGELEEIWIEVLDAHEDDIHDDCFESIRGWRLYGMDL